MNVLISYTLTILIDVTFGNILLTRKRNVKYTSFLFIINYIIFLLGYGMYKSYLINTNFSLYVPTILGFIFAIYFILVFKESFSIRDSSNEIASFLYRDDAQTLSEKFIFIKIIAI